VLAVESHNVWYLGIKHQRSYVVVVGRRKAEFKKLTNSISNSVMNFTNFTTVTTVTCTPRQLLVISGVTIPRLQVD
jgi:hypothetical protein